MVAGVFAIIIVGITFAIAWNAPYEPCPPSTSSYLVAHSQTFPCEPHPHWAALKDYGGAVAGSWVLLAALFSLIAAWMTVRASRQDAEQRLEDEADAIRQAAIAQVTAFWRYMRQRELEPKLADHIGWLKKCKATGATVTLYRRYMGEGWLSLAQTSMTELVKLGGEAAAQFVLVAGMVRHIVQRFNQLNSGSESAKPIGDWIDTHQDVLNYLHALTGPAKTLLESLGSTPREIDAILAWREKSGA